MADYLGLVVLGGIFTLIVAVIVHLVMNKSTIDNADKATKPSTKKENAKQSQEQTQDDEKKKKKKKALEKMAKQQQLAEEDDDDDDAAEKEVLSKKEELKAQRKAERDEYQRQMEQQQEEQKQRMEAKSDKQKVKDEEREAAQAAKEEAERKRKEEQAKKDQEEYDKWKDMFSIDQGGSVEQDIQQESQSLLSDFINYIKQHKVVVLESLASHFGLRTQEVINRIQHMEQSGMISGVMDDKGKFIFISEQEMKQVADFIRKRGRVSLTDIAQESNRLIDLEQKTLATDKTPEINLDDLDAVVEDPTPKPSETSTIPEQEHVITLELEDLT
eukprot:c9232_g1_i1.p1 GENE.c9232_g1_i1~~c9232_g1_i1.p1  ORF type:complete len:330 (-),score=121.52 c9232_g1_i1:355-1344(-)